VLQNGKKSGCIWRSGKQFHHQVGQEDSRAAKEGDLNLTRILIQAGADVWLKDKVYIPYL